jgi:cytochrome b561
MIRIRSGIAHLANREPQGYSIWQVGLHWLIAALIIFQYLAHDGMEHAWHAQHRGVQPSASDATMANIHAAVGIAVLLLAALRLAIRLRRGAPPVPPQHNPLLRLGARLSHFALYVAIFAMPFSGMAAWFGGVVRAGQVHSLGATLLFWLVVLHALAALAEHFVMRTDVLTRMLKPEPR